ncbi:hypothetical protein J437_LFUL016408 [Ladona fulva]|uniref:Reverse transcriptase domain-containing protein n=1 Tax=Ladona fulva TaxID=123851 RepID=A0A8K0P799_LADFU|nr:hypothetical protein J437_LFUL016408 [Ladona fulva]
MSSYLEAAGILSPYQHGFRKNRSTKSAIYGTINRLNTVLDKNLSTCAIFSDYMDTVGDIGLPKTWLLSYLIDRVQRVIIYKDGTKYSSFSKIINPKFSKVLFLAPPCF